MKKIILILCCFIGLVLASCNDNEDTLIPKPKESYQYSAYLLSRHDTIDIVLKDLNAEIKKIESPSSLWLEVTGNGIIDESPYIQITANSLPTDGLNRRDSVLIYDTEGKSAYVKVVQIAFPVDDNNSSIDYSQFKEKWDSIYTIKLAVEIVGEHEVATPWAPSSITNIPETVLFNMKRKNGWKMVFIVNNYMGLYNVYTGTLRIFCYVFPTATLGGKYDFLFTPSGNRDSQTSLYHAMQYGFPAKKHNDSGYRMINNSTPVKTITYSVILHAAKFCASCLSHNWNLSVNRVSNSF